MKLFRNREEFQQHNKSRSWAEAFYQEPFCYAYYPDNEINPYHWMIHEGTHQLNNEYAHLKIPQWIDEGLATYFATSKIEGGKLMLGRIDPDTYPVWLLPGLSFSGDIEKDIKEHKIIPLRLLISGQAQLDMNKHFNTYYIHWWSFTHFLFHYEGGRYSDKYRDLIMEGGTLENFDRKFEAMNNPAASCEVSTTKHLSFRLVRNLSEEGFPTRAACGNDSEDRPRCRASRNSFD